MLNKLRNSVREALGRGALVTSHNPGELRHLPGATPIAFEPGELGPRPTVKAKQGEMRALPSAGTDYSSELRKPGPWKDPRPFADMQNLVTPEWIRKNLVLGDVADLGLPKKRMAELQEEFRKPVPPPEEKPILVDAQARHVEAKDGIMRFNYDEARREIIRRRIAGIQAGATVDPQGVEDSNFDHVYRDYESRMRFYSQGFNEIGREVAPIFHRIADELTRRAELLAAALEERENDIAAKAKRVLGWKHQPSPEYVAAKQATWRIRELPGGKAGRRGGNLWGHTVEKALAHYGIQL